METKHSMPRSVILLLFLLILPLSQTQAQQAMRHRARMFLHRTSLVLVDAKAQLNKGQVYTGDFARALAHQRMAVRLFKAGYFQRAVNHSHRARMLAFAVIRSNKGQVDRKWEPNKDEQAMHANAPSDQQLDRDLQQENPSLAYDDRKAAQADLQGTDVQ